MAWPLVCLLLLTCCSGSFSQPVLTQAPSVSASLGATARLSCTLSSQHKGYTIGWHQQSPGKAPRYLMYVSSSGGVSKGEGVPDRFSGSASGADRYLSINNIQPEDEADYYCGAGDSDGSHSATFIEEVGQKPPCQPSPRPPPTAAPTSGAAPAAKGPEVVLPVSLSLAESEHNVQDLPKSSLRDVPEMEHLSPHDQHFPPFLSYFPGH